MVVLPLLRVLVLRDVRQSAPLLLAAAASVVIAAALLALAPVYRDGLADRSLTRLLDQQSEATFRVRVSRARAELSAAATSEVDGAIAAAGDTFLPGRAGNGNRISFTTLGGLVRGGAPPGAPPSFNTLLQTVPSLDRDVTVVEGVYGAGTGEAGPIPVMLGQEAAADAGLAVGDRLRVEAADGVAEVEVVGLVVPREPASRVFHGSDARFALQPLGGLGQGPPIAGLWVDPAVLYGRVAAVLPGLRLNHAVELPLATGGLTSDDAAPLREALEAYALRLQTAPATVVSTPLADVLRGFEVRQRYSDTPILVLSLQFAAVALLGVALIGARVAARSERDRAVLRARGANRRQQATAQAVVGALVALPAVGLAAPLAAFALSQAGRTDALDAITGGAALDTRLSALAWGLGAAGAGLAWLAFVTPAWLQGTGEVLRRRMAPGASVWPVHRYLLDIVLLVVAGVLFLQFSADAENQQLSALEADAIDPVLLASPGLLLLGVALVAARVTPWLVDQFSRAVGRVGPPHWLWLGLVTPARRRGMPMFLFGMALCIGASGTLAATQAETFDATVAERVDYAVGADVRAVAIGGNVGSSPARALQPLVDRPGVKAAGAASRIVGTIGSLGSASGGTLLAVQPRAFADIVRFRDDFADGSAADVLAVIDTDGSAPGVALPADAGELGVWVRTEPAEPALNLDVRLIDGEGRGFISRLGKPAGGVWEFLSAALPAGRPGPWRFMGLSFENAEPFVRAPAGSLLVSQPLAGGRDGASILDASFSDWISLGGPTDAVESVEGPPAAASAVAYHWFGLRPNDTRLLVAGGGSLPVPVLIDRGAAAGSGLSLGDTTSIATPRFRIPLRVAGLIDLFPTLNPFSSAILVADLDAVQRAASALVTGTTPQPVTEVWVRTDGAAADASVAELFEDVYLSTSVLAGRELLAEARNDPFSAAGSGGLFLLGFLGLVVVGVVAFVLTVASEADERAHQGAVMQSVGARRRATTLQTAVEVVTVLGPAVVLGALLGRWIADAFLAFLNVGVSGEPLAPPFRLHTDWGIAWAGIGALLVGTVVGVSAVGARAAQRDVARTLRLAGD